MRLRHRPVALLAAAAATLAPTTAVRACMPLWGNDGPPPLRIAAEEAVITWDARAGVETFTRRAEFAPTGHGRRPCDFGFLVPTPTAPDLAAADERVCADLGAVTRPEVVTRVRRHFVAYSALLGPDLWSVPLTPGYGMAAAGAVARQIPLTATASAAADGAAAWRPAVEVLSEGRVGGYDAAVLRADDPGALNRWLKANGYPSRPALTAWLAPYVRRGWAITAFKVAGGCGPGAGGRPARLSAVRMRFRTDRPFYPYREPISPTTNTPPTGRLLRVYFVSDARAAGTLGDGNGATPWGARVAWTAPLPRGAATDAPRRLALDALPGGGFLRRPWMTVFEDTQSPRPATDEVYFAPSEDAKTITPEPWVRYTDRTVPLPVEVPGALLLATLPVGAVAALRRRGRRAAAADRR